MEAALRRVGSLDDEAGSLHAGTLAAAGLTSGA